MCNLYIHLVNRTFKGIKKKGSNQNSSQSKFELSQKFIERLVHKNQTDFVPMADFNFLFPKKVRVL